MRGGSSDLVTETEARAFLDLVPHARFVDVSGAGHMVARPQRRLQHRHHPLPARFALSRLTGLNAWRRLRGLSPEESEMPDTPVERTNFDLTAALEDAEARFAEANPTSAGLYEQACRAMPGGNTRTVLYYPPFPVSLARGDGCYIEDADGHRYADFVVEQTAGIYGHSEPAIQRAISSALAQGITLGGPTPREGRLAEIMCERFPSLDMVRFTNSGTEANLMALSAARAFTGRTGILAFEGSYHGSVLSFGAYGSRMNVPFEWVMGRYNDMEGTRELIEEHKDSLAAIIIEPMTGSGGCIPAEREFLQMLRDAGRRARHPAAIRRGDDLPPRPRRPAEGADGITPDMTSFGKYIGGGLTFGAFGGKAEVMSRFDPREAGHFGHAGTFNNNVLTMQAAIAGMSEVFTEQAAVEINAEGHLLRQRLNGAIEARNLPAQVTGFGSMMMFHPTDAELTGPADTDAAPREARALFHLEMMARAHYVSRRGMMVLSLPMGPDEFDGLTAAFEDILDTYGALF